MRTVGHHETAGRFGDGVLDVRGVPRLAAVGDVQANYGPLIATLEKGRYAEHREGRVCWRGGRSALLFIGDLVDSGVEPAEVLVAVANLHGGARQAGGHVILVTGNHDDAMLKALDGTGETRARARQQWFANGGLETLARLAHFDGCSVSQEYLAAMYAGSFGDLAGVEAEIESLCAFVRDAMRRELDLLRSCMRPVALVNDCVLAFHAAPNMNADGLERFVSDAADERHVLWDRRWLSENGPGLPSQLAALKARLDDPARGVSIRCVLFGHTRTSAFEVPGYAGRQFRIGPVVAPDPGSGSPCRLQPADDAARGRPGRSAGHARAVRRGRGGGVQPRADERRARVAGAREGRRRRSQLRVSGPSRPSSARSRALIDGIPPVHLASSRPGSRRACGRAPLVPF